MYRAAPHPQLLFVLLQPFLYAPFISRASSHSLTLGAPTDDPHVPEQPPVPDTHISNILHLSTIAARLLVLVPLLAVLSFPRVEYVPTNVSDEPVTHQTSTSYLLPPSPTRTAYGTFHNDANGHSQAPSGTVTPVPSEQGQGLNGLRQGPLKPTPKKEVVDPDPVSRVPKLRRPSHSHSRPADMERNRPAPQTRASVPLALAQPQAPAARVRLHDPRRSGPVHQRRHSVLAR